MILILSGLPGSGKSRFRTEWMDAGVNRAYINYDELRETMFGKGWKFNYDQEAEMKKAALEQARGWLKDGIDVCIDNTNLSPRQYERWVQLALEAKTSCEVKVIDTPLHVCIDQDRNRKKRVGRAIIEGMALRNGLINWNDYGFYGDKSFMVVDVDGTLADLTHRRPFLDVKCLKCATVNPPRTKKGKCDIGSCSGDVSKKDHDAFFAHAPYDKPFGDIIRLVSCLKDMYIPLIVSGRPEDKAGQATENWLHKYGVPFEHLFMRRGGDFRPDTEVKQEILGFLPKDRIAFVLDDRDSVVKMWRDNGLRVLQVAPGDF